jgi:hypothetical protein
MNTHTLVVFIVCAVLALVGTFALGDNHGWRARGREQQALLDAEHLRGQQDERQRRAAKDAVFEACLANIHTVEAEVYQGWRTQATDQIAMDGERIS